MVKPPKVLTRSTLHNIICIDFYIQTPYNIDVNSFDIAKQLKERRMTLALSQAQLARISGISQQHISLIEQGRVEPGLPTLNRILAALDLSMTVQPTRATAQDWLGRLESLRRFNEWEKSIEATLEPDEALQKASDLAEMYMRVHGAPARETLEAKARAWKEWRLRLSRCAS